MPRIIDSFDTTPKAVKSLNENILDVYFIKRTTRTLRRMHCTLNLDHIPHNQRDTAAGIIIRYGNINTSNVPLPVWDIFMGDWRSFYLDSVQNVIPSKMLDDALEKVREIVSEELDEETENKGFIEGIVESITYRITQNIEKEKEALMDFSISKIKDFIIRAISTWRR